MRVAQRSRGGGAQTAAVAHAASDRWAALDRGPGQSLTRVRVRVEAARGNIMVHCGHTASAPRQAGLGEGKGL
jgi:hypothetical protein